MANWMILSEGGQELTSGIQSEAEARKAAQRHANETGAAVCLTFEGAPDDDEGEWIVPSAGTM